MSLEHSPARALDAAVQGDALNLPEADLTYWNALIDEKVAGDFLDLTARTMQAMRQRGGGPRFCRLSARCIKYRRVDLRQWSESLLRSSTRDAGEAVK